MRYDVHKDMLDYMTPAKDITREQYDADMEILYKDMLAHWEWASYHVNNHDMRYVRWGGK